MKVKNVLSKCFTRRRMVKIATISLLILIVALPAFAQDGEGVGGVVNNLVSSITDIIQSVAVGAGILGLTFWGIGKVVRPMFPHLLIGIAVVLVASQVVESLVSSLGAGA
jgi:type IV secretory pathway VirB2 component (pilin)